jgi:hypothetical protein
VLVQPIVGLPRLVTNFIRRLAEASALSRRPNLSNCSAVPTIQWRQCAFAHDTP